MNKRKLMNIILEPNMTFNSVSNLINITEFKVGRTILTVNNVSKKLESKHFY